MRPTFVDGEAVLGVGVDRRWIEVPLEVLDHLVAGIAVVHHPAVVVSDRVQGLLHLCMHDCMHECRDD